MSGVKIKKIPMKNLSPKEMAELAFDRGVSRGSSSTANTLGRGGLKRGAYGQGVGKMNKGGAVKYTGPLPKSKPTAIERWQGFRSTNKPTTSEEQERIGNKMAEKFKKSKKAQRYKEGGNVISDADAKLLKRRLLTGGEAGNAISDKDVRIAEKKLRKYEDGGEVRGMGRAYQGKKRGCKIR